MFAAGGAKLIGRDELQSPASSPRSSPDPAITELLRSHTQHEFAYTTAESGHAEAVEELDEEDEVELQLFAGPALTSQTHKIRLSSPEAASGDPGFLVKRPRSSYFADEITSNRKDELAAAAVTGAQVLDMAKVPWPGCALPWKVTTLTPAGMRKEILTRHGPIQLLTVEEKAHKRTRKGKKSRMALRKKMQAIRDKEAARKKLAAEAEEAEREKRTRRNREKKVKKKARDQAKKMNTEAAHESPQDAQGAE